VKSVDIHPTEPWYFLFSFSMCILGDVDTLESAMLTPSILQKDMIFCEKLCSLSRLVVAAFLAMVFFVQDLVLTLVWCLYTFVVFFFT
jgi:hypothetical protein